VPQEPAYADKRSQDGEAPSASERAKGMDAFRERPAMGHGSPEAGLGELAQTNSPRRFRAAGLIVDGRQT